MTTELWTTLLLRQIIFPRFFRCRLIRPKESMFSAAILISNRLARYNADGTYDPTFNPSIEFAGTVFGLGLQSDGKVLVGGSYEKANGFNRKLVSRINPDGTTDTGFDTAEKFSAGNVNDFAVQPDGKILVAGGYTYDGSAKSLVRLNSNGSLDPTFNANITGNSGAPTTIFDVELQSDGKIIIGGTIKNVDGTSKNAVARLNSNGTLDTTFNVILSTTATIYVVVIQSRRQSFDRRNFQRCQRF